MRTTKPTPAVPAPMKRANFFLPPSVDKGLRTLAQRDDCTQADIVRKALEQYLRRHKALA